jgi:hypothetical protein
MINFTSFAEIISVCIKKVGGDDVEEGQRTIRRKAREKRKTQQGL